MHNIEKYSSLLYKGEKKFYNIDNRQCFERSDKVWKGIKVGLAVAFAIMAYASLIPASFASIIWKVASVTVNLLDAHD